MAVEISSQYLEEYVHGHWLGRARAPEKRRSEVAREELTQALRARVAEHVSGRALLLDPALVQEHRTARDLAREADLVGHDQHRPAFLGEVADLFPAINDLEVGSLGR
jgi:hypothetical protein